MCLHIFPRKAVHSWGTYLEWRLYRSNLTPPPGSFFKLSAEEACWTRGLKAESPLFIGLVDLRGLGAVAMEKEDVSGVGGGSL